MLNTLRNMFESVIQQQETSIAPELALTVLLYEVANADMAIDDAEQATINKIVKTTFDLTSLQADELISQAKTQQQDAISMQEFTAVLTKQLGREHRVDFIRAMWQVAYADGVLDGHEEYIIRKIADLIYVNHSDYIKAKLQVLGQC